MCCPRNCRWDIKLVRAVHEDILDQQLDKQRLDKTTNSREIRLRRRKRPVSLLSSYQNTRSRAIAPKCSPQRKSRPQPSNVPLHSKPPRVSYGPTTIIQHRGPHPGVIVTLITQRPTLPDAINILQKRPQLRSTFLARSPVLDRSKSTRSPH